MQRHLSQSFEFWYYSCPTIQMNIDLNIERTDLILEMKELQVIHKKFYSYQINKSHHFFHEAILRLPNLTSIGRFNVSPATKYLQPHQARDISLRSMQTSALKNFSKCPYID